MGFWKATKWNVGYETKLTAELLEPKCNIQKFTFNKMTCSTFNKIPENLQWGKSSIDNAQSSGVEISHVTNVGKTQNVVS